MLELLTGQNLMAGPRGFSIFKRFSFLDYSCMIATDFGLVSWHGVLHYLISQPDFSVVDDDFYSSHEPFRMSLQYPGFVASVDLILNCR